MEPGTRACFLLDFADTFFRNVAKPSHLPARQVRISVDWREGFFVATTQYLDPVRQRSPCFRIPRCQRNATGAREMAAGHHGILMLESIREYDSNSESKHIILVKANDDHPNLKAIISSHIQKLRSNSIEEIRAITHLLRNT
jgi:hypothetical protein